MNRRVVVTGLGMVTPLGTGVPKNWEAVCAGKSGIGTITKFDPTPFACQIAGEARDFRSEDFLDKQQVRRFDIFVHFAVASARMAMADSGLKINDSNRYRVGCLTGSGLGGLTNLEYYHRVLLEQGPKRISPFFIPGMIANMAPGQIAIEFGVEGTQSLHRDGLRREQPLHRGVLQADPRRPGRCHDHGRLRGRGDPARPGRLLRHACPQLPQRGAGKGLPAF